MPNDVHTQRRELDQLVEDYTERGVSRREFLRRAGVLGLSLSAAGALLEACGSGSSGGGVIQSSTVDLLNVWTGEEQASFNAVVAPFKQQNKITINLEATRDLDTVLTSRLRANNPPDIAILPNPGKMQQLAKQGKLIPLDSFLPMSQIHTDYSSAWTDLGSYNGKLYAIFYKAANKGTIWYNPAQFQSASYQVPATWQDLITLSNTIAGSGKYPWSMGVASQAASGWPAADWLAQIYLNQSGPAMYDKWVAHQIPWTDPSIKTAFQAFGQIAGGTHYINGAPQTILATGFQQASYLPFTSPPQAYMYYLGDFAEGFITTQFPSAKAGTDFNFFPFPTITSQYAGAVTGGADVVVAMKNTTAVQALIKYLATAQAQEIWVKRGGFTAVNKSVDLSAYPDPVAQASAKMLTSATTYRFGADDLMPPAVEDAFWKATLSYISNPGSLDSILSSMESTASQAYTS
ncbi:MAG TPA: ABC transporter substrate-binding protein [Ktedonobacterales bacterium]|nr:ABC transporter substrate-binding protein [Ktedonobacterales bacterium]